MRLNHERARRARGDDGFTLIELVISVAILGIVSAALLGIVFQYVKTTSDTSARLNESTDEQFISTYWQNDVSSLGRRSLALATATFSTDQSVFVGLRRAGWLWQRGRDPSRSPSRGTSSTVGAAAPADPWGSTPQQVAYVTVPNGSRFLLQRVRCKNGVAGTPLTVAHNLTAAPDDRLRHQPAARRRCPTGSR